MASEEKIVAQVLAGKTEAFRELVEQYHQPVFRFARNMIGDQHDAEDVTQEVFLAALDHLKSYDPNRASLLTWLFTLTRNRCANYLKRKRPLIDGVVVANMNTRESGKEGERNEFWRHLDEALESLPVEQKTAFVLAEIEGLSYAEIAQIEQATLGTVKSRIHRAKQRLRAVMARTEGE